jgi:hypothetical protein
VFLEEALDIRSEPDDLEKGERLSYSLGLIFSNSKECAMWIEKKEKGLAEGVALYRVAIHPFLTKKRKRWRHVRLTM